MPGFFGKSLLFLTAAVAAQIAFAPLASASCDEFYAKRLIKFKKSDTSKASDAMQSTSGGLVMGGGLFGAATLDATGAVMFAGPAAMGAGLALYGIDKLVTKHTDSMWSMWNHIWDSKKLLQVIEAQKDNDVPALRKNFLSREREKLEANLKGFFRSINPKMSYEDLARIVVNLDSRNAFCSEDPTDPAGQKDARRIIEDSIAGQGNIPAQPVEAKPEYTLNAASSFTCELAYSDYLKGGSGGSAVERVQDRLHATKLSKKQREWAEHIDRTVFYAAWAISSAYKTKSYYAISNEDFANSNLQWLSNEEDGSFLISVWIQDRMLRYNKEVRKLHPNLTRGELVNLIVDLDRQGAFCRDPRNPADMLEMRAILLEALGAKDAAAKTREQASKHAEKFEMDWPY